MLILINITLRMKYIQLQKINKYIDLKNIYLLNKKLTKEKK